MAPKKIIDQLTGVEACIAARNIRDTIVSTKSQKEKLNFVSAFIDDLESNLDSKITNEEKSKKFIKEVSNWLVKADKKCSKQLVKQGFKTEKDQNYYIDIQMIYQRKNPLGV